MLKKILNNKYKLMLFAIAILLFLDMLMHKGLVRYLIPKSFPLHATNRILPISGTTFINKDKNWVKAVNSVERMHTINDATAGIEFDIYFDTAKKLFDVHHDEDNSTGLNFETLLKEYKRLGLRASMWIDFKNLNSENAKMALDTLIQLRNRFTLANQILVESSQPELLTMFSDSGLYTSYYTPMFNPYLMSNNEIKNWVDSVANVLTKYPVHAMSGYYFQSTFLHNYFPEYPILIWSPNDKWSVVNWLYKKKIDTKKEVFISLYQ
jgi:hypothetical protein